MKILYFSPIEYRGLKQRPQYIAEGLAREHEVTYVDPTVSMMKFLLKGGERPGGYTYRVNEHLKVVRLNGTFSAHRSLEALGGWIAFPEWLQLRTYLREADLIWIGYCPWYSLLKGYRGAVVYDKMDDDTGLTQNELLKKLIRKVEPPLVERADLLFVTAQKFHDEFRVKGKHPYVVPNAVDRSVMARLTGGTPEKLPGRVFGYVGMISHWFDMDAVRTILDADSRNRVVLVGPSEIQLPAHPRLVCTGRVPKEDVNGWIRSFDICLYPFRRTPLIDTIDPVKIYEYLAQNKPVLAADSLEMNKFGPLIFTYRTQEQLRELAGRDLPAPFACQEQQSRFVEENCWDSRMAVITEVLNKLDRIEP